MTYSEGCLAGVHAVDTIIIIYTFLGIFFKSALFKKIKNKSDYGARLVAHPDRRIIFGFKEPSSGLEIPASYRAEAGHHICLRS